MIGIALYFLLVVGIALLLSAAFRRLSGDNRLIVPPEEDAAFSRRIEAIEREFGTGHDGIDRRR